MFRKIYKTLKYRKLLRELSEEFNVHIKFSYIWCSWNGSYQSPDTIVVDPRAPLPLFTLSHEMGHHFHYTEHPNDFDPYIKDVGELVADLFSLVAYGRYLDVPSALDNLHLFRPVPAGLHPMMTTAILGARAELYGPSPYETNKTNYTAASGPLTVTRFNHTIIRGEEIAEELLDKYKSRYRAILAPYQ